MLKGNEDKNAKRYEVVVGESIEELVRLVNLKTKFGWECVGGICYCKDAKAIYPYGNNSICDYYCQSIVKKSKKF